MQQAVQEAVAVNDNEKPEDLSVALDGTWQKRGFSSLNGVVSCTLFTGKVADIEVLCKYCRCLDKSNHSSNCSANYIGTSGGMEPAGAIAIFSRSLNKYGVRYINYLGDGDTKSYKAVSEHKPYGEDIKINKMECLNHVAKRMGARLRKLKLSLRGKKLSDNLPIGGANRLTDNIIDQLQSYYGKAISENLGSTSDMRRSIWAIYFHKMSSDANPSHGLCPPGPNSWCKYNNSLHNGSKYKHKHSIAPAIMEVIKPIFRDLSSDDLLKKCLHGRSQNMNESLNHLSWCRIPKSTFVGLDTLQLGVLDAVACYNEGNIVKGSVFEKLGINPGVHMIHALKCRDDERIHTLEKSTSKFEKQARKQRRLSKKIQEEDSNGQPDYDPGMH